MTVAPSEGVSLWRQIERTIIDEIDAGLLAPGMRLPADTELAIRFGVNRHTVRRALSQLQTSGLLRSERGRGTFVVDDVLEYRLGTRTRFTQNLLASQRIPGRRLISITEMPAGKPIAKQLQIKAGSTLSLVCLVGEADGLPISVGWNYFPNDRLPGIAEFFRDHSKRTGKPISITTVLKMVGVDDYRRKLTRISSRPPTPDEMRHLRIPAGEYVLETESVDEDIYAHPVVYARTCFRSSRVQFVLEP
jgi:GntR family phosphonate transport system transcriptional regulator